MSDKEGTSYGLQDSLRTLAADPRTQAAMKALQPAWPVLTRMAGEAAIDCLRGLAQDGPARTAAIETLRRQSTPAEWRRISRDVIEAGKLADLAACDNRDFIVRAGWTAVFAVLQAMLLLVVLCLAAPLLAGCGPAVAPGAVQVGPEAIKAAIASPEVTTALSAHVEGLIRTTLNAELTTRLESQVEASLDARRATTQTSGPQTGGDRAVQIGTVEVDGLTLAAVLPVLAAAAVAIVWMIRRGHRSTKALTETVRNLDMAKTKLRMGGGGEAWDVVSRQLDHCEPATKAEVLRHGNRRSSVMGTDGRPTAPANK